MKAFDYDLAISAVGYDSLLVEELSARLRPRIERVAIWASQDVDAVGAPADTTVLGRPTRVVLVLLHRLWAQIPGTAADNELLRQRMKRDPGSVVVLVLDDATVPDWLEPAARHELAAEGLDPLVETVLRIIADNGGPVLPASAAEPELARFAHDTPKPFLDQARAQMALKRELDRMAEEVRVRLGVPDKPQADAPVSMFALPNRFVGRHDTAAVSFSWIAGRAGTISEGRLLVIEWAGVSRDRGMSSLKAARACREVVYQAEGAGPDSWCWRVEQPHGRASSTSNLVAEWIDGVALATPAVAATI